jgi:hypothetical protein
MQTTVKNSMLELFDSRNNWSGKSAGSMFSWMIYMGRLRFGLEINLRFGVRPFVKEPWRNIAIKCSTMRIEGGHSIRNTVFLYNAMMPRRQILDSARKYQK